METEKVGLRRDLGLWGAAAIVVGTVIGSGVFVVPKRAVIATGSPDWVTLVWIFGGILSLAGALTYAELSSAMPEAGGEYVYLREAYGRFWGFLYGWTQFWVAKSGSIATLASGFFIYISNFVPVLEQNLITIPLPIGPGGTPLDIKWGQIAAMGVILFLAGVNYFGVKVGGNLQIIVTIAKVGIAGWHRNGGFVFEPGQCGQLLDLGTGYARRGEWIFCGAGGDFVGLRRLEQRVDGVQ